jgi:hypothetical protein
MDKKIEVPYNEKITIESIKEILTQSFPEYRIAQQNWGMNSPFLRLKKNFFVQATVFVKQKQNKNITKICINGSMSPVATICFGYLFYFVFVGDFMVKVETAIREGLLYIDKD